MLNLSAAARGREGQRLPQWPLEKKKRLWEAAGYRPFPDQWKIHESTARFKIPCAGARFGKSRSGANDVLPETCTPGAIGWIVAPNYDLARKEFGYLLESLVNVGQALGKNLIESLSQPSNGKWQLRTKLGSSVETRTAENPESLLAEEVDFIVYAEASRLAQDIHARYGRSRIATRLGRVITPSTPFGMNWLFEWWQKGQTTKRVDPATPEWLDSYESWTFATACNPLIPWEEVLAARNTLHPDVFAEQWLGQFVRLSGLVYRLTDDHIVDDADIPENWWQFGLWRAIDFGYVNPFVCLWGFRDEDGAWWIIDELYATQKLLREHAAEIRGRHRGIKINGTAADHDAQDRAELNAEGVPTIPAKKDIRVGIFDVKNLMVPLPNGKTRFHIHRRCVNTIREFGMYSWPSEEDRETKNPKDEPVDAHNHAMDAVRYLVSTFSREEVVAMHTSAEHEDYSGWMPRGENLNWMG